MNTLPIGIMDSGVGGLTVVRELMRLLPGEDIIYCGDSANCPYGNKTREQIVAFTGGITDYLCRHNVKLIAYACNTISSAMEGAGQSGDCTVINIIEPAARRVAQLHPQTVGVIGTEFTIASGCYQRKISELAPDIAVYGKGSPTLAAMIDRGDCDNASVDAEILREMPYILAQGNVHDVILACTHYPVVYDRFAACCPDIHFIDPAREEALAIRDALAASDSLSGAAEGHLTIRTTGDPAVYAAVCRRLGIDRPADIQHIQI